MVRKVTKIETESCPNFKIISNKSLGMDLFVYSSKLLFYHTFCGLVGGLSRGIIFY